jgi:plasmid replication initiation protein
MPKAEIIPTYQPAGSVELKKHAAIVHTSGQLTLIERKLVNVLLLNAYNDLPTSQSHSIPVKFLSAMVGWEDSHDFAHLKKALKNIVGTPLELNVLGNAGKERWSATSLLSSAEIEDGMCTYEYSRRMAELLYAPEMYAVINIAIQKEFRGGYALTLYENCVRFRKLGSTPPFEIGRLRKLLGADAPMYDNFKHFSNFVIKKGVKEINRVADINIEPKYVRVGRKVTAIEFIITEAVVKTGQQAINIPTEVFDGSEDLKKQPLYERLRGHGIGEVLALQWLKQEPDRVLEVVEHVESKDKKIKSKSGYIVKAMEQKYELGVTKFEAQKEAAQKEKESVESRKAKATRTAELYDSFKKITGTAAIKALTKEQQQADVTDYISEVGQGRAMSYNKSTGEFADSVERFNFRLWQSNIRTPVFDRTTFDAWLVSKNINPKNVGDLPT